MTVQRILCEGNFCADLLANQALNLEEEFHLLVPILNGLHHLIIIDIVGGYHTSSLYLIVSVLMYSGFDTSFH